MISAFGIAIYIFFLCKLAFGILGWYSSDGKDALYRKDLDRAWDRLHDETIYDILNTFLNRLVNRIQALRQRKYSVEILLLLVFSINLITLLVAIELQFYYPLEDIASIEPPSLAAGHLVINYDDYDYKLGDALRLVLGSVSRFGFLLFFTLCLDLISVLVTWSLLKRAARSKYLLTIFLHLFIDIIFVLLALIMGLVVVIVIVPFGIMMLLPDVNIFISIFIISTVLPSILYFFIGFIMITAFLIPDRLKHIIQRTIYLITTDKKPVLSQLGNIAGGISGLLAGLLKVITI